MPFFDRLSHLEHLISSVPDGGRLADFIDLVSDDHLSEFAFSRLEDPAWLELLQSTEILAQSAGPIEDPTAGLVSFPRWPPAQYLLRIAATVPEGVASAIRRLAPVTNPRVIADLLDCLLKLPPSIGADLFREVSGWVESRFGLAILTPERFARLILHWAAAGYQDPAIRLADSLLKRYVPASKNAYASWELEKLVKLLTEPTSPLDAKRLLVLLATLLAAAIDDAITDKANSTEDFSYVWRPELSGTGDILHGARDVLTSALIQVATKIVALDPGEVATLIEHLETFRWPIFERIGLHILRLNASDAPEIIAAKLRDPGHFDTPNLWPEYSALLAAGFSTLSEDNQRAILEWIMSRDYTTEAIKWFTEWRKEEATPKRIAEFRTSRRLHKLVPLKGQLPDWWRSASTENADLAEKLEEYSEPPRLQFDSGFVGSPPNPLSNENLCEKSDDEIIDFLRAAAGEEDEANLDARTSAFSTALSKCGDRITALGGQISSIDLPAQFPKTYFFHVGTKVRNRQAVPWEPALALGEKACHPNLKGSEVSIAEARRMLLDMVQAGLRGDAGAATIPFDLASKVWSVIEPLTDDPDPGVIEVSEQEIATLILRGTRTWALRTAVDFGFWQFRSRAKKSEDEVRSFSAIPEVRKVLEKHVDPASDPAEPVRAALGQLFPYLYWLDRDWAAANFARVFPGEPEKSVTRRVAWASYLIHDGPSEDAFALFQNLYAAHVDSLDPSSTQDVSTHSTEGSLAEHLMILLWKGRLSLSGESLIARFFKRASPNLRKYAIAYVGTSARNNEKAIPPEIRGRLDEFWDWYLSYARSRPASAVPELGAFGWWFGSGKFDDEASLDRFIATLVTGVAADAEFLIGPRLLELAPRYPQKVTKALRLAVRNTDEPSEYRHGEASAYEILEKAIESAARPDLDEIADPIDAIGAAGFVELRDLWERVKQLQRDSERK